MEYSWSDQRETQTSLVRISEETRTCKKRSVARKWLDHIISFPHCYSLFVWGIWTIYYPFPSFLYYPFRKVLLCIQHPCKHKPVFLFRYPTDLFRPLSITLQFLISTALKCLGKDTVEHQDHWKESKQKNRLKITVLYLLSEWSEAFLEFLPGLPFFINSAFHFLNCFFLDVNLPIHPSASVNIQLKGGWKDDTSMIIIFAHIIHVWPYLPTFTIKINQM